MAEEAGTTPPAHWLQVVVFGRNPARTMIRIVVLVIVVVIVSQFVLLPIKVQGISMAPTYKEGRVNFVNRLSYVLGKPRRGDVVAIRMAGEHAMLMKRIIGMPGERVSFTNGVLFINGQPVAEPYVKLPCTWNHPVEIVGPDEYYVVGDNRTMGFYDHTQGIAERRRIMGKLLL